MIHNLGLVKAAWDLKETLQTGKVVPGMQEQVIQVEFMSEAGEPRPLDTVSEGAMQACRPLCCPATGSHWSSSSTPLAVTCNHWKRLFTKLNLLFLIDPEISPSFEVM